MCFAAFTMWSTCTSNKKEPIFSRRSTHRGWVNTYFLGYTCKPVLIAGAYYLRKFVGDKCNIYEFLRAVSDIVRIDCFYVLHCLL